jgi:hypothetical protein
MANILEPAGAILILLAIWLYACDRSNEFMPWIGAAGIVLLGLPPLVQFLHDQTGAILWIGGISLR